MLLLLRSSNAWLLLSECQSLVFSPSTNNLPELAVGRSGSKDLSERDICSKFIGPAVKRAAGME